MGVLENGRMFDMGKFDALNSVTKYPSILTYHALGERGALTEELTTFDGWDGPTYLTEKIDGTNGRIVLLPGSADYFIGSREELLYARGDRVGNPALGIVQALKPLAERLVDGHHSDFQRPIVTLYLEVYGGRIGAQAKQYSTKGAVGYRLFDLNSAEMEILDWERHRISSWRDDGGQEFLDVGTLQSVAERLNVPRVPYLSVVSGEETPKDVEGMAAFLAERLPESQAGLDETAGRRPEGLVLRDFDRSRIAKARFQDYERTLKRRQQRR
ncbi:RNA ligase family protein [Actinomadura sp. 3N508]|uniref:RNA ligase family protein n=1 Tax=Actinomadura sp. 3N508 TaxID=3375153 RepID=UPI00378BA2AF